MAPAQLIEPKDLPPEVLAAGLTEEITTAVPATPEAGLARAQSSLQPPRPASTRSAWEDGLQDEALALLAAGREDVWDILSQRFESRLIIAALSCTHGRRIEAAHKLGIGRNTITRKMQELALDWP
jgi:two-component system nitrogen regulation response regulator GlnG